MNATQDSNKCSKVCWLLGAVAGLVALIVLTGSLGLLLALVLGIVVLVIVALLLQRQFCNAEQSAPETAAEPTQAPAPAQDMAPAVAPEAPVAEPTPEEPVVASPAPEPAGVAVGSTQLPGEQELSARKGSWRYDAEPAQETDGAAPVRLDSARESGADDLKLIKGVGPKLEALLHSMGYFHFDQIAKWGVSDVAWMDDNLEGFKGRVSRDDWVAQAGILASGGETEFSKRNS